MVNSPPPDDQFPPPASHPGAPQPPSSYPPAHPPAHYGPWSQPPSQRYGGHGGPAQVPPPGFWPPAYPNVQPKNPAVAVVASLLLPGLGSMLSGNPGIGLLILVLWVISLFFWLIFLVGVPFTAAFWIWGMIQAHSDAVRWNRNHGIIS
jgi:TM2 domain-containing membrane protein YozV